jgi:hypothetical protein
VFTMALLGLESVQAIVQLLDGLASVAQLGGWVDNDTRKVSSLARCTFGRDNVTADLAQAALLTCWQLQIAEHGRCAGSEGGINGQRGPPGGKRAKPH